MARPSARAAEVTGPAALAALMLAAAAVSLLRMRDPTLVDDAYIFARYARNLAQGYGFVWNRGEAPVEGFTSFLYTVVLAALEWAGLSSLAALPWIGLLSTLGVMALTWRLARRLDPGHTAVSALAVALTGLSPSYVLWTTAGMEMPFHAALLMLSVLSYLAYVQGATPAWLVGCCWVLATLTRPETLTLFGATALFELVRRRIDRAPLLHRDTIVLIGSFGAAYGAYYAWRWLHFGYPFPNTYYAKTGAGLVQIRGGLVYLKDSLRYLFGEGAALVALAALLVRWRGPATRDRAYVAIVVATAWVGIVFVGGDHMDGARFLVATLPLVFALAAAGLSDVGSRWLPGRRASVVIATVLVLLVAHHWARTPPYPAIWRTLRQGPLGTDLPAADASQPQTFPRWTLGFVVMGQTLRQVARPGDSVAVVPVGAIGYYSELRVVDMVGLVDPVIAHQPFDPAYTATWRPGHDKGDGRYVLSRRPTFIQLTDSLTSQPSSEPGRHAMQYKSVVEIWRSPEFHERYVFHPIRVQGGWYYNVYRRVPGS